MKHIYIINPAAGVGASEKEILPEILAFIKEHGDDYEIHRSLNKAEIYSYVRSRASQGDPVRFYAVGGDGTICDVLNGLMGFDNAELAVIPCGSGNDFVKNFTHKENFLKLDNLAEGTAVPIDVLQYNDRYCINMLNIGADCDVVIRSGELREKKQMGGVASYATAAFEVLPKGTTYRMTYIDENGNPGTEDFMLVAVGNGKYCGGGFKCLPKAKINDGFMDVGLVRLCKGLKLMQMLVKYHQGTHIYGKEYDKYGKYMKLSEFSIKPLCDVKVSIDGEVEQFEETHCKIIPGGVKFVVPKGSAIVE